MFHLATQSNIATVISGKVSCPHFHRRQTALRTEFAVCVAKRKNKQKPPHSSCADTVGDAGWLLAHKEFLQTHSDKHQLPLSTFLEPFVEQALWPWLHCHDPSCEGSLNADTNWEPCAKEKCPGDVHALMKATCTCKLTSDHVGLRQFSHCCTSKSKDTYFIMFW